MAARAKKSKAKKSPAKKKRKRTTKSRGKRSRKVTQRDLEPVYPWERQPSESAAAFAAFEHYLNSGELERNLRGTREATGRAWSMICEWSSKNDWVKRAEAHDRHLARKRRRAWDAEVVKMNERQANNAMAAMAAAMGTLKQYIPTPDNPQPPKMRDRDAIRLFAVTARIERLARGEADQIHEAKGKVEVVNTTTADDKRASLVKLLEDPKAVEHMAAISKLMGTDGSNGKG